MSETQGITYKIGECLDDTWCSYIFWTNILVLKMMFMVPLTAYYRFRSRTFANPEDSKLFKIQPKFDDPNVERVRRAHRNDLESIIPLILAAAFYDGNETKYLYMIATVCRILHTVVYAIFVAPQPTRLILFLIPNLITVYFLFAGMVDLIANYMDEERMENMIESYNKTM